MIQGSNLLLSRTKLAAVSNGGKDCNPQNMATTFFETRKKGNERVEPEIAEKYAEIHDLVQSEPSLTNIEVVERCFGPACKSDVIKVGGGITIKELKGCTTSKAALWEDLKTTRKKRNHYKNAWIF
ncbi:uncharacterized protein LOC114076888 [Solanum pennellii]|uniref:Uncharacterized protein LOC114076888 n=1 Tax=Solanum pennellii TaxID=28526 RepID=A0ABM1V9G9_SOLPN|nr:uncharacterized protein LOC114076888 [Solanum pennellii]